MGKYEKDYTTLPVLVGHPFAPIGMGEHVRSTFRAFHATGITLPIRDVYGLNDPDLIDIEDDFTRAQVKSLSSKLNIFHINGDEVKQALAHLEKYTSPNSYNIIYPAWELSNYPAEWARQLELFNEIWAPSQFIADALSSSVSRPVIHMPLACELRLKYFLGRRYFEIPESAYVFLFFFDFASYMSRKNPLAVIHAFKRAIEKRPHTDVRLVLKCNRASEKPQEFNEFINMLEAERHNIVILNKEYNDTEIKNLIRCCDCFVSLHRSEGYGRGMAEAMFLGKPVIATGYSGNLDFMNKTNSYLVNYELIPVGAGEYPCWQGQVWADPDVDQAAHYMVSLIDEPQRGRAIGAIASRTIRQNFNYRITGLRYRNNVNHALKTSDQNRPN